MDIQAQIKAVEMLRDDKNYFGSYGQEFESNSMIRTLLTNPLEYGKETAQTVEMLRGTYMHQQLLAPERELELTISQENSRNSKAYKEQRDELGVEMMLLQKEIDLIDPILAKVKRNLTFMDYLQGDLKPFEIEEPRIKQINGVWFKAKADRINRERGVVFDIKTTADITKWKSSFYKYGYDTASYIYQELFDLPMVFLVICMKTGALGYKSVSTEVIDEARLKVEKALAIKDLYFGEGGGDIDQLIDFEIM